jgi:hypothetical protein
MQAYVERRVMRRIITQGREIVSTLVLLGKWVPVQLSKTEVLYLYLYQAHSQALVDALVCRAQTQETSPNDTAQRAWHQVSDEQGCGPALPVIQQRAQKTYQMLQEASTQPRSLTFAPEDALALGLKSLQLCAWIDILLAETPLSKEEQAEVMGMAQGWVTDLALTASIAPDSDGGPSCVAHHSTI